MEKFKQKAFVLQEQLEFKRDSVGDPARRINSLMKVSLKKVYRVCFLIFGGWGRDTLRWSDQLKM